MAGDNYHIPVMLKECIAGLQVKNSGVYVDLTFGGGGHSIEILKKIENGHLYAFDQDADAKANAEKIDNSSFTFIEANFRYVKKYLKLYGVKQVDGILADLGVSSHQIDDPGRGFSTRFEGGLDMRMDRGGKKNARLVLNTYDESRLHQILGMYGEVRNARTLAKAITSNRANRPIETVDDLKAILTPLAKRGKENRYFAQVFQAIRIEVNDEMAALREMLEQCGELLREGGRLVVMSYHSLEDRMVKNYIMKGNIEGKVEKDFYGNVLKPLEAVNRKPVMASESETKNNNRARSAKLRIAKKTG